MQIIKKDIIKEKVKSSDLTHLKFQYSCESCSYFISKSTSCNLGYKTTPHIKFNQDRLYNQTGHLAICRFLEID